MEALARTTDPITSHEAAHHVKASALRAQMLHLIRRASDGVIWDDLRAAFPGVKETSISPRVKELERMRVICRDGEKRLGASGVRQLVCRAVGGSSESVAAQQADPVDASTVLQQFLCVQSAQ